MSIQNYTLSDVSNLIDDICYNLAQFDRSRIRMERLTILSQNYDDFKKFAGSALNHATKGPQRGKQSYATIHKTVKNLPSQEYELPFNDFELIVEQRGTSSFDSIADKKLLSQYSNKSFIGILQDENSVLGQVYRPTQSHLPITESTDAKIKPKDSPVDLFYSKTKPSQEIYHKIWISDDLCIQTKFKTADSFSEYMRKNPMKERELMQLIHHARDVQAKMDKMPQRSKTAKRKQLYITNEFHKFQMNQAVRLEQHVSELHVMSATEKQYDLMKINAKGKVSTIYTDWRDGIAHTATYSPNAQKIFDEFKTKSIDELVAHLNTGKTTKLVTKKDIEEIIDSYQKLIEHGQNPDYINSVEGKKEIQRLTNQIEAKLTHIQEQVTPFSEKSIQLQTETGEYKSPEDLKKEVRTKFRQKINGRNITPMSRQAKELLKLSDEARLLENEWNIISQATAGKKKNSLADLITDPKNNADAKKLFNQATNDRNLIAHAQLDPSAKVRITTDCDEYLKVLNQCNEEIYKRLGSLSTDELKAVHAKLQEMETSRFGETSVHFKATLEQEIQNRQAMASKPNISEADKTNPDAKAEADAKKTAVKTTDGKVNNDTDKPNVSEADKTNPDAKAEADATTKTNANKTDKSKTAPDKSQSAQTITGKQSATKTVPTQRPDTPLAKTTQLSRELPEYRKLRQTNMLADSAHKVKIKTKRVLKRIPGVKSIAGSRAFHNTMNKTAKMLKSPGVVKTLRIGGAATAALAIGDAQMIRSISKFNIPDIAESFVDSIRYFPDAASYIYNNPTEALNEMLGEGLLVGAGESVISLYENISPTGYVYDHNRKCDAWIADSQGSHKISYIDENGNPKTTVEKQEYIYSFVSSKKDPSSGRLIVYRPAEGLTNNLDANGNKIRELSKVAVAEFDVENGYVTREYERHEDGTITTHTYDKSNPTYTGHIASGYSTKLDEYPETNEIFARYGIPETKYGALAGQETATDVLNKIKIGKRISSKSSNKGHAMTIIDWENSQDDKIVFADRYEGTDTYTYYHQQSTDTTIRDETTISQSVHSIPYQEMAKLGIDVSGDKKDPKVRERILKGLTEKLKNIKELPNCETIKPYEENTVQKYHYAKKMPYSEHTEGYARFYKNHPLFGQRDGVYVNKTIDYETNTVNHFDAKGNLVMAATYDTPNEDNHYQSGINNIFIPTDTKDVHMQFTPMGEFLGFQSDECTANWEKINRLTDEKALLADFNHLKDTLGVKTLPEIRQKLNDLSQSEDVSAWMEIVDVLEKCDIKTFDAQKIEAELKKCTVKNEQFEKQFAELEKQHIKRDKDGNIRISTKLHPMITGKEITETDEDGQEYKVIKVSGLTGLTENMTDFTFVPKTHKDFPPTIASKNEFFTKTQQNGDFNYYRVNYNGSPETQNYGGYVEENQSTGICHVFDQNGKCVYIDVPTADAKDDANWASNPNSDKYQRIRGMVVESERGGIYSDEDILEIAEKQQKTGIPFEYGFKLAEYEKVLKKPFENPNHKGYYDRYDVLHAGSYEQTKGATTNAYITEQEKYLSELEDILNKQPQQTPTIQAEKKALAKQREILTRMRQKPENDRIAEAREQAILFDTQVKRTSVPLPKHVAKININDYISNKDDDLTQPISLCHQQKNPDKTVYRFNAMNQQCTGIMIEDKKTGVCKIYDNNGCLMDIDKPLNNSEEEQINPYAYTRSLRYRDIVKKVNTRMALYNYISNPEHPFPELCTNEERDTYQSRLANHAHQQQQDDFSIDVDMPVISAAKTETNLDFNPLNDVSTTELPTPPSDLLAQNDDGSYKNNLMNQPTNKPNSNKDNQAVATNEEESQTEDKDTAKNPKETDPKKAVASTAKSGLKSSLRNAQENNSIQIDAERVEEQINNSNQTAVASQSR